MQQVVVVIISLFLIFPDAAYNTCNCKNNVAYFNGAYYLVLILFTVV